MGVPYTFGTATTSIPLSNLDANFNTPVTIGNATVGLGNTVTTVGNLTLTNATISSGNVTVTTGIFGAGSNTAPSITTTGDTNTGIYFPAADTIAFTEGGVEAMRITSAGDVGIGTNGPAAKLDVRGSSTFLVNATNPTAWISVDSALTTGSMYNQWNTTSSIGITGTYTNHPYALYTNNTERMRIDSSGNLLVRTTTIRNSGIISVDYAGNSAGGMGINDTDSANASAYIAFLSGGTFRGSITNNNNSAVAYNTTSDYRLKENIAPMIGALAKVAQLKPCTYTWKTNGSAGQGFIAHELQAVVPDAVTGEKDAVDEESNPIYQGVDTSFLVATLTAAIQELKAELDSVKAELQTLKGN